MTTPRLLLRPLELADAAQSHVLFPRWEIVRYMKAIVPWPYPPDGAFTYYRDVALPAMERGEAWHWSLRLREAPDQLVGTEERAFVSGRLPAELWELTADEWRARHGRGR